MGIHLLSHWGELLEVHPKVHLRINTSFRAIDWMHVGPQRGAKSAEIDLRGLFLPSVRGRNGP